MIDQWRYTSKLSTELRKDILLTKGDVYTLTLAKLAKAASEIASRKAMCNIPIFQSTSNQTREVSMGTEEVSVTLGSTEHINKDQEEEEE